MPLRRTTTPKGCSERNFFFQRILYGGPNVFENVVTDVKSDERERLEAALEELRPKVHRFCARMTGSVIDGEDVVQETFAKAIAAFSESGGIRNYEAWVFRIAHNAALDFLRRRARQESLRSDVDPDALLDPISETDRREAVAASLRTFMRLPTLQRSTVLLMDVLGYSLHDITNIMDASLPSVKSALHRGRARLRELAKEPEDLPVPTLGEPERSRLVAYIDRFNARDFESLRDMIAQEVRLDLVSLARLNGRQEVADNYFTNYARTAWRFTAGMVEGRPAALAYDPSDASRIVAHFVLFEWRGDEVIAIRDFVHAPYAIDGAEYTVL